MNRKPWAALCILLSLAACGPKMEASRDRLAGRVLSVTNRDSSGFKIKRIIANDSPDNPGCNDYPDVTLAPGESWNGTFILCGNVTKLSVETDRGTSTLAWN